MSLEVKYDLKTEISTQYIMVQKLSQMEDQKFGIESQKSIKDFTLHMSLKAEAETWYLINSVKNKFFKSAMFKARYLLFSSSFLQILF